jgi:galactokinase
VTGFDACLASNVLKGSGLSSSAAYEVMLGSIMNHLFAAGTEGNVDICTIGRYAENCYFGKPCGLMDQLACCVGGVLFIDFKDIDNPGIRKVPSDFRATGYALCIIDSGADHSAMTDEYSPIPREMQAVAACFGKEYLREVDKPQLLSGLRAAREKAGDRAVQRALHFFADSQRTVDEARALDAGDMDAFLKLVNESGRSSHMYLQNVFPLGSTGQQAVGLTLALCDEFLAGRGAFRVHGGGFAGTVQAFVPLDMLDVFKADIERVLGGGSCHVLAVRQAGSVRIA